MRSFILCISHQILSGRSNRKYEMGGACGTYGERRGEVHTGFWWGHPTKRDHLEDLGLSGKITLKLIFKKGDGRRRLD